MHFRAEGEASELRKLEGLQTEGDPDDGDAPSQTEDKPHDRGLEPAEDEPKDVADCFHFLFSPLRLSVVLRYMYHIILFIGMSTEINVNVKKFCNLSNFSEFARFHRFD